VLFIIELSTRRIHIAGIAPEPDAAWMSQMSRNLTDVGDGFLAGKRFLIHDRDPLFTVAFRETLAAADVQAVRLPLRCRISMRTRSASSEPSRNHVWTGSFWSGKRRSDERCLSSWSTIITSAIIKAWATC
jgi:hypothetical protein